MNVKVEFRDVDPAAAELIIGMMQAVADTLHRGREAEITQDDGRTQSSVTIRQGHTDELQAVEAGGVVR